MNNRNRSWKRDNNGEAVVKVEDKFWPSTVGGTAWLERLLSPETLRDVMTPPRRVAADWCVGQLESWRGAKAVVEEAAETEELVLSGAVARLKAMSECSEQQTARQPAGLRTNTRKQQSAEMADRVSSNHASALFIALESTLDVESLCTWHGVLGDGLTMLSPGKLRDRGVSAGARPCCSSAEVKPRLEVLCRLVNASSQNPFAVAAAATVGLLEIHPFFDGNGRLARILGNWVLKKLTGLPFPISLCATDAQRTLFVNAAKQAFSSQDLGQMISLVLDQVTLALGSCERIRRRYCDDHEASLREEAAKKSRADALAMGCMICLGDDPNVATLCCGAAIHLNCLAEWLSNSNTCIQCRAVMPRPIRQPAPAILPHNKETFETTAVEEETSQEIMGGQEHNEETSTGELYQEETIASTGEPHNEETAEETSHSCSSEEHGEETTTHALYGIPPPPPRCFFCNNHAAPSCSNSSCGVCCLNAGQYSCGRHGS